MRICIPTESNEGRMAKVFDHFGSAEWFTIFDTGSNEYEVICNCNSEHEHGSCMPTEAIRNRQVDAVFCKGMGLRAIKLLNSEGIKVYRADCERVEDLLSRHAIGKSVEITEQSACQDHSCH